MFVAQTTSTQIKMPEACNNPIVTNSGIIKTCNVSDLLLSVNPPKDTSQIRNIEGAMIGPKWLPKAFTQSELKKLRKR